VIRKVRAAEYAHNSQCAYILTPDERQEKAIVVIGSGASGVEAVETALARGAAHCIMVAKDDKVCR